MKVIYDSKLPDVLHLLYDTKKTLCYVDIDKDFIVVENENIEANCKDCIEEFFVK